MGHVVKLNLGLVGGGPKISPLAQPQVSGANRATESFSARINLDAVIASRSRGIGEGAGEALAVASGDGWQAGEIEKRGEDIDALHERAVVSPRRMPGAETISGIRVACS